MTPLPFTMLMNHISIKKTLLIASLLVCTACSPQFDWREIRGTDAPYTVLMPAKPASASKEMQLQGIALNMNMTASEVSGINFAVGSAKLNNPGDAGIVLDAMKKGMINNIQGTLNTHTSNNNDIEVRGQLKNGEAVLMAARFVSKGPWVYQVVILGPEKVVTRDVIDTFMTSFKTN